MPVNYAVAADVVDLRNDVPHVGEAFLVDTNAWFWSSYGKAGFKLPAILAPTLVDYPDYLNKCVKIGAALHWCGLTLAELAHRIEKIEHEIWNDGEAAAGRPMCRTKEFRHNYPAERAAVIAEVELAWKAIEALGTPLPAAAVIDKTNTAAALVDFRTVALDGYDLFLLQAARSSGVTQVISDDGDFCGVTGLTMFTSNQAVLAAAQAQGKLIVR
jgi:hypothetical protein